MSARRLFLSGGARLVPQLSRLSIGDGAAGALTRRSRPSFKLTTRTTSSTGFSPLYNVRFFGTSDNSNSNSDKDNIKDDEDPFGINFEDGLDRGKIGPGDRLPPLYKRDAATGRLTGEVEQELSEEEKLLLKADPIEKDKLLVRRVERHWKKQGTDESGFPSELNKLGERVRSSEMGLNVLGRSVKAQISQEELDDGTTLGRDETGFSHQLTTSEFKSFSKYMKKRFKVEVTDDDIPVEESQKAQSSSRGDSEDPDDPQLALKWLTTRAQRQMDDLLDDNPYADLMPGDLFPSRVVNRKQAKPIPRNLLHHNNVELLQYFLTPTGQIMNRVQSRLGARDQRRIAKLVKRARCLGLIPYVGQFKTERHGWVHAKDIHEDREWEKELVARGLVVPVGHKERTGDSSQKSD